MKFRGYVRYKPSGLMKPMIIALVLTMITVMVFYGTGSYSQQNSQSSTSRVPIVFTRHTITVDGDPSDWTGTAPTTDNTWTVSGGEWIWKDAQGDERTDFANPDTDVDITEVRITADTTNLYILIRFADITSTTIPWVSIAVDTDHIDGSGNWWFPDNADTGVYTGAQETTGPGTGRSGVANWEKAIVVCSSKTGYYDTSWTWTSAGSSYISDTNDVIEISMPWTDLGVDITSGATVRFTIMSARNDGSGAPSDISGVSDALDCITDYSISGGGTNTWDEVQTDQDIDYYFDVTFSSSGDAVPELGDYAMVFTGSILIAMVIMRRRNA